ncbi:DNA-directed RNA polymerase, mitochondrial isoform X2 [Nasonia vitripennis]|uniref:DNA-directed RNA polymerase n=1 Tax=Nasonia vitripennis TaxID=7425 RepID=A0A7M7T819_NASVI|nr:DNA-directed RNA polymerase, mitochondrial isoform X2 [Nasonia vitripennis]
MYRLFKCCSIFLQNSSNMSTIHYSLKMCLFCNNCHQQTSKYVHELQIRHQSSSENAATWNFTIGKKKFKRKVKKYAELKEVPDSAINSAYTTIRNLDAAYIPVSVDKLNVTLDESPKIEEKDCIKMNKSKTELTQLILKESSIDDLPGIPENGISKIQSNLVISENEDILKENILTKEEENDENELLIEELKSSGIVDETVLIKSSSLANLMYDSTKAYNVRDSAIRLEKSQEINHLEESEEKIIDKERKARESLLQKEKLKQFNKIILGYVDVCVNSNELDQVNDILYAYRKNKSNSPGYVYINDISVFNRQIEKLAAYSDLKKILHILQTLRKDNINLNAQTYVYILDCIGRMTSDHANKKDILKQIHVEMQNDRISLNDVMTKTTFVRDQRLFVDKMAKLINSEFEPRYGMIDTTYNCRLLENMTDVNNTPSSSVGELLTTKEIERRLKKQIEMEIDGQVTVRNIAKKNSTQNVNHWRHKLSNLEKTWERTAMSAFKRNLSTLRNRETFQKRASIMLYPYLSILKPDDYICIIMREVRKLGMGSEMYSLPFNSLCRHMGDQVYKMYEAKTKQTNGINDKIFEVHMKYCHWLIKRNDKLNNRLKWMTLESEGNKYGVTLGAEVPVWQANIHASIGRFLFNIIVNDLKLDANYIKKKKAYHGRGHYIPAFFKIFRHSGVMLKEEVKPHPIVSKLYRDSQPENLTFDTTLVPSLCPPRPWVSVHSGGYIVTKTDIVRVTHMGNQQWDRLINAQPKQLYPALDSLNQLGSIPWAVNTSVLDVAIKVFQNDGSVKLNVPQPPSVLAHILSVPIDADPKEKKKINKAKIELKRKKNEMYSLWCDALYRLSLANHFRNEIFWLPHNMDFRGRVYPIPPHLNHLGSDLARSMLVFALKKPLGPKGLDWLKLHTINLTGFKKRESISERLKYADKIIENILDSAENPLTGKMWWATSDEPWQTLAACMEIAKALKSSNPTHYMTGFPIHQDGSCNGLQHYAALGRDQIGAQSVNLFPSHFPQDVYSSVATMVDERRREDASNGNLIANVLEGFIKRKVIKQTIMTTVYGVTWFGAKLQIARQLKGLYILVQISS